jgi:very-short-patch-repair endonuclease
VVELALRQHGVVARRQLVALGLTRRMVDRRVQSGRLYVVHHGVYAVGRPGLTMRGRMCAAVLAAGYHALLSHRSAAALWGIFAEGGGAVEVTLPVKRRPRPGIVQHHSCPAPDEVTVVDGISVTTVPRTLLDIASKLDERRLRRAVNEAERLRLWDALSLEQLIARHRGRRGVARLAAVLADGEIGATVTRSDLEILFLEFLADAFLPYPRVNFQLAVPGATYEVDCAWPDRRLIVELDGHATHATRSGYEGDRERDRRLHAAGWRVVRITWRQLTRDPGSVRRDLATLLGV